MNTTTENGNNVVGDTIRREECLQWLGGLFCGEGCISGQIENRKSSDDIYRKKIGFQIIIVNTDKILLDKAEKIIREQGLKPIVYATTSGRYRALHVIKIIGLNKMRKFLTLI